MTSDRMLCVFLVTIGCAAPAPPARGDEAAQKALQHNQLQRQQQQEQLQLRMQQYQIVIQSPPADLRQQQAIHQLEIEQRQRQQELHYRQTIEPQPAVPSDDEGTRRAKAQIEQQRALQQSQQQLQRFDVELKKDVIREP